MTTKTKDRPRRPVIYDMGQSNQCVYASAGIIKPTLCINAFDCLSCPMDKKMQRERPVAAQSFLPGRIGQDWGTLKSQLMKRPASQRWCRHMLSGLVDYKICPHSYNCARCPYDQMVQDGGLAQPTSLTTYKYVAGVAMGVDHYFHSGHAWARVEYSGRVRLGLDDFSLRLLGHVDGLDLPGLGATVHQGENALALSRETHRADVLSPVDGIVVARNPKVLKRPELANDSPYEAGWLMVIQPTKLKTNLGGMYFGENSLHWMEDEVNRLVSMVTQETGQHLAATGGRLIDDVYGQIPDLGWDRLVHEFLRT